MSQIVDLSGVQITSIPPVAGVRPLGSSILVELLTDQELSSSAILVQGNATGGPPQAYVLDVGNGLKKDGECVADFKVGDRVVLNGSGTFVPKYDNSERIRLLVEPHNIKAVIVEAR